MANEKHLDLLKQGVNAWNQWQVENPKIRPDLSGANLSGMDLSEIRFNTANLIGVALSEADLRRANFQSADLSGADLFKVDLFGANLRRADLRGADLIRANLIEADLHEANLSEADFSWADLIRVNLSRANLSRAAFIRTNLSEANLSQANLTRVNLRAANLGGANLNEANLTEADLSGAYLSRADLLGANLFGANLNGANLGGANLIKANLSQANLSRADIISANLSRADLSQANLSRADLSEAKIGLTTFGDIDLQEVRGLETIKHFGRSYIDIHTIFRSEGKISRVFLKGMGIPDTFITDIGSLVNQPIEYFPCFISHSNQDEQFAERLYADLQLEGIHCWFAPEGLKTGSKHSLGINELLQTHDKLLLVLSKYSVVSQWIEQEVEAVLARERKYNKMVLFPLRLDETVMEIENGWPALIKNTRPISDFCNWQNHDAYDKIFQQLLCNLKVDA